jgi:4-hydroxy-3-polyprenylbenzoate decarboxylase
VSGGSGPDRRTPRRPWVVGVSGASGTPYARAVLGALLDAGLPVDLIVSRAARLTIRDETGLPFRDGHWRDDLAEWLDRDLAGADVAHADVAHWGPQDLAAGPSSGSYPTRGMVVVPASTGSIAGIALGLSKDLLQRAADVTLKERRPLLVVPRETPYTRATLAHLLSLHDAGTTVLPASPAFYAGAQSVQQLVDFVAAKVLDVLGVEHDLLRRWTGRLGAGRGEGQDPATGSAPSPMPDSRGGLPAGSGPYAED